MTDNQRTCAAVADLSAQLHQLETKLASWQAQSSNEALQNKLEALTARVLLVETRTDRLGELKSDARQANAMLSTMVEDVESLFGQMAAVSKQLSTTATRLEGFRRHFERSPNKSKFGDIIFTCLALFRELRLLHRPYPFPDAGLHSLLEEVQGLTSAGSYWISRIDLPLLSCDLANAGCLVTRTRTNQNRSLGLAEVQASPLFQYQVNWIM